MAISRVCEFATFAGINNLLVIQQFQNYCNEEVS